MEAEPDDVPIEAPAGVPGEFNIAAPKGGWLLPIYSPEGKYGTIDSQQYANALKAGYRLPVISPQGTGGSIPLGDYDEALKRGYKIHPSLAEAASAKAEEERAFQERRERRLYGDRPVAAGVLGALRPLTANLSDVAITGTGIMPAKEVRKLKEYNEGATIAGESIGLGVSLFPPVAGVTAVGAVAKAGRVAALAAEKAGIAKMAGRAVAGTVEGALWGAGQAVSEHTLGEHELNGERLLATVGLGGVIGVGVGGLGGLIEKSVLAIKGTKDIGVPSLGGLTAKLGKYAERFADEQTLKAMGFMTKDFRRVGYKKIQHDVAEAVRNSGALDAGSLMKRAEAAELGAQKAGERIDEIIELMDAKTKPMISGEELAEKIRKEIVAPLKKGNVGDKAVAARINAEADLIAEQGDMSFRRTEEVKRSFDKYLKFGAEQGPTQESLKDVRRIVKERTEEALEAVSTAVAPGRFDEWKTAKKTYGMLTEAADVATERAATIQANRQISLTDYMAGLGIGGATSVISGGPVGIATGIAGTLANKFMREKGPIIAANIVSKIAKKLSGQPENNLIAEHFAKAILDSPVKLGKYGPAMADAATDDPMKALAAHVHLSQIDPEYAEVASMAGFASASTEEGMALVPKIKELFGIKGALKEHDDELSGLIEDVFRGKGMSGEKIAISKTAIAVEAKQQEKEIREYNRKISEVQKHVQNPTGLINQVASQMGEFGQHAPAIATSISTTAGRAMSFLDSKIKQPLPSLAPLAPEWKPSKSEIAEFLRYHEATFNPHSILKHAARGTLSSEHLEAVRTVYPQLYAHIQNEVAQYLAEKSKRKLSYKTRVLFGMLADFDPDGTINGAAIEKAQKRFATPTTVTEKQAGDVQPTSKGATKLTLARRAQTPLDRTANREG